MPKKEVGFMKFAQERSDSEASAAYPTARAPSQEKNAQENMVNFWLNKEGQLVISFANEIKRWLFTKNYEKRLNQYKNSHFSKDPQYILELDKQDPSQDSRMHVVSCDEKHEYGFKIEGDKAFIVFDSYESRNEFAQALGLVNSPTVDLATIDKENNNTIIFDINFLRSGFTTNLDEFKSSATQAKPQTFKPEKKIAEESQAADSIDSKTVQAIISENADASELEEMSKVLSQHPSFQDTPKSLTSDKFFKYLDSAQLIMNAELKDLIKNHILITLKYGTFAEKKCYLKQIFNSSQILTSDQIVEISKSEILDEHINNFIQRVINKKPLAFDKESNEAFPRDEFSLIYKAFSRYKDDPLSGELITGINSDLLDSVADMDEFEYYDEESKKIIRDDFNLFEYISPEEEKIAAFLGVSSKVWFQQDISSEPIDDIIEEGYVIGFCDANFTRKLREFQDVVVRQTSNYTGSEDLSAITKFPRRSEEYLEAQDRIWADFYATKPRPTIEDAKKDSDRFKPIAGTQDYFDSAIYKKMLKLRLEATLKKADDAAEQEGKKAYIHFSGEDYKEQQISPWQKIIFHETIIEILEEERAKENLKNISDIDLSKFFDPLDSPQDHPFKTTIEIASVKGIANSGIKLHNSANDAYTLSAKNKDKLLVATYNRNPRSYEGGEFWLGKNESQNAKMAFHAPIISVAFCGLNPLFQDSSKIFVAEERQTQFLVPAQEKSPKISKRKPTFSAIASKLSPFSKRKPKPLAPNEKEPEERAQSAAETLTRVHGLLYSTGSWSVGDKSKESDADRKKLKLIPSLEIGCDENGNTYINCFDIKNGPIKYGTKVNFYSIRYKENDKKELVPDYYRGECIFTRPADTKDKSGLIGISDAKQKQKLKLASSDEVDDIQKSVDEAINDLSQELKTKPNEARQKILNGAQGKLISLRTKFLDLYTQLEEEELNRSNIKINLEYKGKLYQSGFNESGFYIEQISELDVNESTPKGHKRSVAFILGDDNFVSLKNRVEPYIFSSEDEQPRPNPKLKSHLYSQDATLENAFSLKEIIDAFSKRFEDVAKKFDREAKIASELRTTLEDLKKKKEDMPTSSSVSTRREPVERLQPSESRTK